MLASSINLVKSNLYKVRGHGSSLWFTLTCPGIPAPYPPATHLFLPLFFICQLHVHLAFLCALPALESELRWKGPLFPAGHQARERWY